MVVTSRPEELDDGGRAPSRWQRIARPVPGLALAAAAVVVAFVVHAELDAVSPLMVAVVLGAVFTNLVGMPVGLRAGIELAARRLLRAGVVLLGFQLSLSQLRSLGLPGLAVVATTVAVTFFGTQWIGRRLGLSSSMSLLVATGFSICGASAIAAMEEVSGADEEEVAFAIALVTLCGSLAIVALPAIGPQVGLHGVPYGNWVGASVHDIGQVVAAASAGGNAAVNAAVVVKLSRVVLLAPLVAGVSLARRRLDAPAGDRLSAASTTDVMPTVQARRCRRRPPAVPLFVVGFLAAVVLRSTGTLPDGLLSAIKQAQTAGLALALFGLGCGVHVGRLRRLGARPLLLGLASWILVAGIALVGTHLLPHT